MAELVGEVKARLPRVFESDEYKGRVEDALQAARKRHGEIEEEMVALADEQLRFEATANLLQKVYDQMRASIRSR